ncbi:MAG: hypothetical protein H0U49_00065 [Parachlamydiaceae bacterium]|jgi:hypothetical protein|nr:hypothetical protein [Parachlamydiaceae bacterium]
MINKTKKWWEDLVLTCEEVTRLSFDVPEERKLTVTEKLKLKFHRSMCILCRRYYKQGKFLQEAMTKYQKKSSDGTITKKKMSNEMKEKIKRELQDSVK